MTTATPPELGSAGQQFLSLVEGLRPDLHRYASRLVGSAFDGEDIVQDTLAKAFYALSQSPEMPELRPWLFRIARNTAIDFLRRYERNNVQPLPETEPVSDAAAARDPEALRAALSEFMTLPVSQRSAVILKDVLDESLEDIARHLGTTIEAVKALLVRGRSTLKEKARAEPRPAVAAPPPDHRVLVQRYVSLFNAHDWTGVQALLAEEVRLDLVAKSQRQGKSVGGYFARYAAEAPVRLETGRCEGREVIGVFREGSDEPAYVIILESDGGRVSFIRDYRYVPYMASELEFERSVSATTSGGG